MHCCRNWLAAAVLLIAGWQNAGANEPAWSNDDIAALIRVAGSLAQEGLQRDDDLVGSLFELLGDNDLDDGSRDLKASAAFRRLANRFAMGQSNPGVVDPDWHIGRQAIDVDFLLTFAVTRHAVEGTLRALLPTSADYIALRNELARIVDSSAAGAGTADMSRQERLAKLRVNMERWRWLPRAFPQTRVEVRIAEYQLAFYQEGGVARRHDVIVGALDNETPVFTASIYRVIFNPWWEPPARIISEKLIPRFRKDPSIVAREGFEVRTRTGELLDAASIDWRAAAKSFPYRLRQKPGQFNALGKVKFDMPNPFSILLHDTPSKSLFSKSRRTYSSGCVRVRDAVGLAEAVVRTSEAWPADRTRATLEADGSKVVALSTPIPVFVLYLTATVGPDGTVSYLEDVYGRDATLTAALEQSEDVAVLESTYAPLEVQCSSNRP